MRAGPRYSFRPVGDLLGPIPVTEMARRLKVDRRSVYRYMHNGIPDQSADRLAVQLGWVPYAMWPEWLAITLRPDVAMPPVEDWLEACREVHAERQVAERRRYVRAKTTIARARLELAPKPCEWCSGSFEPKHPSQRFCRMGCSEASRSPQRQKEAA
jgi:hypothetical protein